MEILLTFISAASFAAFILCFASVFAGAAGEGRLDASPRLRGARARAAAVCAVAAFYFIPAGALPPYIAYEWGGFAAAALLVLSAVLNLPRGALRSGAAAKALVFPSVFCFAWALFALLVSRAGAPGLLGSLGTYTATPLWSVAGMWGRAGMALLLALLICVMPAVPRRCGVTFAASLHLLLCAALVTVLLLPWNLSAFAGPGGFFAFWADFIFFWIKASAVALAASRASRRAERPAFRRAPVVFAALMLCAALCVFIEAGMF